MWWLASRPPTLLPASPAVFSITMRSCGVVNLPTMTLLSPFPSVLSPSLSTFPHSLLSSSPLSPTQTIFNFSPAVLSTLLTLLGPSLIYFILLVLLYQPPTHPALWSLGCRSPALQVSPEHQSSLWQPQLLLKKRVHFRRKLKNILFSDSDKSIWIIPCLTNLSGLSRSVSPWSQSSSDWGWTGPESPVDNDTHK